MESRRIITRPHFHKETNMTTKLNWRSIIAKRWPLPHCCHCSA